MKKESPVSVTEESNSEISELQKTIEYVGVLKSRYKSEIRLVILAGIFFLFYSQVRELTTLVLASYLVALLLDPVLVQLERNGFGRTKGLILTYGMLALVVVLVLSILVPRLAYETVELLKVFPGYAEGTFQKLKDFIQVHLNITIPGSPEEVKNMVASITEGKSFESLGHILDPLWKTLFAGYNFTLTLVNLCLFPFIVFYIARDWNLINGFIARALPTSYRPIIFPFLRDVQNVIVAYARGQLLVAFLLMLAYSSVLLIIGVPFALPLGIFAGVLSVVPYLGYFFGFTFALLVQLVHDGTMLGVVKLIAGFILIQIVEGNFISPRVLGESTGLHPLIVILSLIVGGTLFGFVGLLLGIPAAAILKLILQRALKPI